MTEQNKPENKTAQPTGTAATTTTNKVETPAQPSNPVQTPAQPQATAEAVKPVAPVVASEADNTELVEDELTALKNRADKLGIGYHPSIGLDKLRAKINSFLNMPETATDIEIEAGRANLDDVQGEASDFKEYSAEELEAGVVDAAKLKLPESIARNDAIQNARKLVRVRVTCLNPNKREWPGEIFTVSNRVVGTFKKFIPFNSDQPYHIPNIIYQQLMDRKCQIFVNGRGENGEKIKRATQINEFGIQVLPPLTDKEIADLKQRQAMASGTQSN